jgi:hypothetical protein
VDRLDGSVEYGTSDGEVGHVAAGQPRVSGGHIRQGPSVPLIHPHPLGAASSEPNPATDSGEAHVIAAPICRSSPETADMAAGNTPAVTGGLLERRPARRDG